MRFFIFSILFLSSLTFAQTQRNQFYTEACGSNIYKNPMFKEEAISQACYGFVVNRNDQKVYGLQLTTFGGYQTEIYFDMFIQPTQQKPNEYQGIIRSDIGEIFRYKIVMNKYFRGYFDSQFIKSISGPSPFGPGFWIKIGR